MPRRVRPLATLAALLALVPALASAQLTAVTSPGGLTGGPFRVTDFETIAYNGFVSSIGVGLGGGVALLGGLNPAVGGVTPSGTKGVTGAEPGPIMVSLGDARAGTLNGPTRSFGVWFGADLPGQTSTFFLDAYNGATLVGTVSLAANNNGFADQFLGFNSTVAVNTIAMRYNTPIAVYIDDLTIGTAAVSAVPEPATFALLGGGLGLLGVAARRRRIA